LLRNEEGYKKLQVISANAMLSNCVKTLIRNSINCFAARMTHENYLLQDIINCAIQQYHSRFTFVIKCCHKHTEQVLFKNLSVSYCCNIVGVALSIPAISPLCFRANEQVQFYN